MNFIKILCLISICFNYSFAWPWFTKFLKNQFGWHKHQGPKWDALKHEGPKWDALKHEGPKWDTLKHQGPKWDALKHKWGPVLTHKDHFVDTPRTVEEAEKHGFVRLNDCCESKYSSVVGFQYATEDKSMTLLFDNNEILAGVQNWIPKGLPRNYPKRGLTPPFVETKDGFTMTVYFDSPGSICSRKLNKAKLEAQGLGSKLYIQNGPDPKKDYLYVPSNEEDLDVTVPNWVKGECFETMGRHYWFNVRNNTSCDELFPMFILYNNKALNAFGFANVADLSTISPRYEQAPSYIFTKFLKTPPKCIFEHKVSTLHMFLTSNIADNKCSVK